MRGEQAENQGERSRAQRDRRPRHPLLYVLHNELHLHGPRFGCGLAQCGACSVLLDGKEIRSCVTPVAAVSGKAVTTLEGMPALYAKQRGTTAAAPPALHPVQQAWIDHQVPACGYCQNGMMIQAADLLEHGQAADGRPDPHGAQRPPLPLRHLQPDPGRDRAGRQGDGEGGEEVMSATVNEREFSRKAFLKGGGALIVSAQHGGCRDRGDSATGARSRRRRLARRAVDHAGHDVARLVAQDRRPTGR